MSKPIKLSPQVAEETSAQRPVNQTRAFEVLKKKASELDGRLSQAELSITPEAITSIVGDYAYSKGEIDLSLSNYSTITQTANEISTYVGGYTYNKSNIDTKDSNTLNSANSATDTKLLNYSTITQTADAIATRVATTDYNGNTIASLINQTATTIAIQADKINLNGAITANNNFKILADGSMEAVNGNFSGKLTATSGSITGALAVTNYLSAGNATPANGKAGINGAGTGDSAIRLWAGATYANRATAPFFVRDDGYMKASSGQIGGVAFSSNSYGLNLDGGLSTGSSARLSSGFLTFLKMSTASVSTIGELLANPNLVISQGANHYRLRISGSSVVADDITSLLT